MTNGDKTIKIISEIQYPDETIYDIKDKNALNKSQITNCLLEVPQKIKLELNNGVLTLKAGSVVIVPNGFEADGTTPKFDEVVIKSDVVRSNFSTTSDQEIFIHYVPNEDSLSISTVSLATSGTTKPTSSSYIFYNTGTNYLYDQNGSNKSFPIAICTLTTSGVTSINQVFNGFGYIGSTVWVDKGVKGLIPNGRNEDGSLKNIEVATTKISLNYAYNGVKYCGINIKGIPYFTDITYYYNEKENTNIQNNLFWPVCVIADIDVANGNITSFNPKLPFRAVDYNDKAEVSGWGMPSNRYIDLTLGATGSTYTAPANGWVQAVCDSSSDSPAFIEVNTEYASSTGTRYRGCWGRATIPVTKGRTFTVYYGGANFEIKMFRFTYAIGSESEAL